MHVLNPPVGRSLGLPELALVRPAVFEDEHLQLVVVVSVHRLLHEASVQVRVVAAPTDRRRDAYRHRGVERPRGPLRPAGGRDSRRFCRVPPPRWRRLLEPRRVGLVPRRERHRRRSLVRLPCCGGRCRSTPLAPRAQKRSPIARSLGLRRRGGPRGALGRPAVGFATQRRHGNRVRSPERAYQWQGRTKALRGAGY